MEKGKKKVIKDPKVRGEWVESVFMARASEQGLAVSKPWGDSNTFDFVVGRPGRFASVQVKSTTFPMGGGYGCAVRKQGARYARGSFDFLAAYVIPEDAWYIIPASRIEGKASVILCSSSKEAKYEEYRETWGLLQRAVACEEPARIEEPAEEAVSPAQVAAQPMGPAMVRMQNAFNFMRRHFERVGVVPEKSPGDVDPSG
jgi:PD-(D/E)XK endonuclease